jgi:hypothetical protein
MAKMEQMMETSETDDFSEKLERAKQIYALLNDVTFGNGTEATISRMRLNRLK